MLTSPMKLERLAKINIVPFNLVIHNDHPNHWGTRCVLQLQYAWKLSESQGGAYETLISDAIDLAWEAQNNNGAITKQTTALIEDKLSSLAKKAKSYCLMCIGHAHIDMNWMWGYDETVSITLDTLRTMLDLMDEYPQFTYAQSQASVYRIVEKYCPEMIDEIKKHVHEGRWEVTATTWVEADKNLPNTESMARQLLYSKQYLSKLLDINPESLNIDYEPDTFGHSINVPEMLCDGGVKYYYHCRGYEKHVLYNWKAPSGRRILVFREPSWYNWTIDGREALLALDFCKKHGLDTMLRVYGVGDHGGGPTRRDIEKIIDMNNWPIFPEFKFGTYGEFYTLAEQNREAFPTVEGELNFIFDGCYTTQTRIKKGNKLGEAMLSEAETISSLANAAINTKYDLNAFADGWKKILFNQFHDILTGSGTTETREHAMGLYQESFAIANTFRTNALRALSDASDTSAFGSDEDISQTRSEGAGVGYGISAGGTAQFSRHAGVKRPFTVYNPLSFKRKGLVEVTLWDWNYDIKRMSWTDVDNNSIAHQVINDKFDDYWGHRHAEVLVEVEIPAMGYTTIVLDELKPSNLYIDRILEPRIMEIPCYVLENDFLRVELDNSNGDIISFIDKNTDIEYVRSNNPMGVFRLIEENTKEGMSAWIVGQYMNIKSLNDGVKFTKVNIGDKYIRQSISYEKSFGNGSKLMTTLFLDNAKSLLEFNVKVHWQEIGKQELCYPQLSFLMPVSYNYDNFRYDVPMGIIERKMLDIDVPAQLYGMPVNKNGKSLMLISDCKYGYRGNKDGLALTLIRSSVDPDPWPEVGEHNIRIALALCDNDKMQEAAITTGFSRKPLVTSAKFHKGKMLAAQSLLELSDNIVLSAVKRAEESNSLVVRYYEINGKSGQGSLKLYSSPKEAYEINLLEQPVKGNVVIKDNIVNFEFSANSVGGLLIEL